MVGRTTAHGKAPLVMVNDSMIELVELEQAMTVVGRPKE
jgi:hypothetical protein